MSESISASPAPAPSGGVVEETLGVMMEPEEGSWRYLSESIAVWQNGEKDACLTWDFNFNGWT